MIAALLLRPTSFKCHICHETFQDSNMLKEHMILHVYACSTCNKNFECKYDRNTHMMIHTGEKSYICIVCHKPFQHNFNLRSHMAVHTEEQLYTCTTCNKSFKNKYDCNMHQKMHTSKKTHINPYEVSHINRENILSQKETIKDHFQNCNEILLSSGYVTKSMNNESYEKCMPQANYSLSSSMCSSTTSSSSNSPYPIETRSKIDFQDEYLDKSAVGVNLYDLIKTRDELMLQMERQLQNTNSSIDINDQSQTSHNTSLNSNPSQMVNTWQTGEWDQRFQNESSEKLYHPNTSNNIIDAMYSSEMHPFSKSEYDLRIASPSLIPINRYQDGALNNSTASFPVPDTYTTNSFEIPHEDFNLNNIMQHHSTSSSQKEVSQLSTSFSGQVLQSSGSLDSHASQKQQLPTEQYLVEKNINLYEDMKLFPDDG